ncbi:hypothetical protein HYX03_00120 [Candidatus Woesearchaeota archaeon]|nr:hypothetical protein [Candidatus Woesearchaeota archaeon]
MTSPIQKALEERTDVSYFLGLVNNQKALKELRKYVNTPGLSIFEGDFAVQRVWEPVETFKSLEYLAKINETEPGKKVSLPDIDKALSLGMQASIAWRVYGVLKYLADKGRLQRDITVDMGDGPWNGVIYHTPNYEGLSLGFTPKSVR